LQCDSAAGAIAEVMARYASRHGAYQFLVAERIDCVRDPERRLHAR
jgi:hypothetical protein